MISLIMMHHRGRQLTGMMRSGGHRVGKVLDLRDLGWIRVIGLLQYWQVGSGRTTLGSGNNRSTHALGLEDVGRCMATGPI